MEQEEQEVEVVVVVFVVMGRLNVDLSRMSSMMQSNIMMRQPRNQISTAVIVLAGGISFLVVLMMLSMIMVMRSWRVSLTRGWGRRKESQERVVRMVDGR